MVSILFSRFFPFFTGSLESDKNSGDRCKNTPRSCTGCGNFGFLKGSSERRRAGPWSRPTVKCYGFALGRSKTKNSTAGGSKPPPYLDWWSIVPPVGAGVIRRPSCQIFHCGKGRRGRRPLQKRHYSIQQTEKEAPCGASFRYSSLKMNVRIRKIRTSPATITSMGRIIIFVAAL